MNVYVRDLARELARRGHHVDVYTRSQHPGIPRISDGLGHGARMIHLRAGPERPYDKNRVYHHLPEFAEGVRAQMEVDHIHYDVVHSHYWLSGVVADELRKLSGSPMLHMFHTLGKMKDAVAQRAQDREVPLRIAVEEEIVRLADGLIAATPVERDQLTDLYGADATRIHVIPPGVDTALFHPLPARLSKERIDVCPDHSIILFVGRIEPLKGIDNLLLAIAQVVKDRPDLRESLCVPIIGGDPEGAQANAEMRRLQELREGLGIRDLVMFIGSRDQNMLPYFYSAAEMVVMPSDYESFGMVALEAMACGTPVIASDVGGLAFLVQDGSTGYRVRARDPAALALRIAQLLDDQELRQRLGQQAVRWARSYAWPRIADRMEDVYRELAHASSGPGPI
jgi:D-inositol-3-phosphate glycosyltransferase